MMSDFNQFFKRMLERYYFQMYSSMIASPPLQLSSYGGDPKFTLRYTLDTNIRGYHLDEPNIVLEVSFVMIYVNLFVICRNSLIVWSADICFIAIMGVSLGLLLLNLHISMCIVCALGLGNQASLMKTAFCLRSIFIDIEHFLNGAFSLWYPLLA